MEIPQDVFEAALPPEDREAAPETESADAASAETVVEGAETPAEGAEVVEGAEGDEGSEAATAEAVADPAAVVAAVDTPAQTFTAEQVQGIVAAAIQQVAAGAAAKPAAVEAVAEVIPAHIRVMLESDDANTQQWGHAALEDHRSKEARIAQLEGFVEQQSFKTRVDSFISNIVEIKENFVVPAEVEKPGADGKTVKVVVEQPVTDEMIDKVAAYFHEHPDLTGVLSVEEVTRRLYPQMVKRSAKATPAVTTKDPAQDVTGRRVIKVGSPSGSGVSANGAAAGRVPKAPAPPPPNETMEQTIDRGMRALGV